MAGIQLTTLGHTELTGTDGNSILSVLAQPKRFALLVYLAVEASDVLVRRDKVCALFWPERDQSDARANLRKSLYFLKQSLGDDVLVTRGDEELGVDPELLQCDATTLLAGEAAAAGGEFLDAFHFSGAPVQWEAWVDEIRQRLSRVVPPDVATSIPTDGSDSSPARPRDPRDWSSQVGSGWRRLARATSALTVIPAVALIWAFRSGEEPPVPTRYDSIQLGSGAQFPMGIRRHYALPPDGSGILYRDTVDQKLGSWWKAFDELEPTYLVGLDSIRGPVFSPDGTWIAFARNGRLWKQPFGGESSVLLLDSISGDFHPGIGWLAENRILYENRDHGLGLLNEEDGTTEILATAEEVGQVVHVGALPTGQGVVVTGCDGWCEVATPRLSFVDLERDTVIPLRSGIWMVWPMHDGRLVMVDDRGTLIAAPFDPADATLGAAVPLLDGVRVAPYPDIVMGADGSLLYIPGEVEGYGERLVWVDREGNRRPLGPDGPATLPTTGEVVARVRSMSLSPGGRRLALGIRSGVDLSGEQLWIKELPDGPFAPITWGPREARRPAWTADGRAIAFVSQALQGDSWDSWVSSIPADGSSTTPAEMLDHERAIMEVALSRDGTTAVVRVGDAGQGHGDIAYAHLDAPGEWVTLLGSPANEYGLALSPDGDWLAYVSEATGRPEVFVRPLPEAGPRIQVSMDGAVEPRWSHDGEELFFRATDDLAPMMAASVTTEPEFRVESTAALFPTRGYAYGPQVAIYEVAPDDQGFIMVVGWGGWYWTQGAATYSRGWYRSEGVQARLQ